MLLPFIYTRTKFHDYRVVTSSSLKEVSNSFVHLATEIARMMIDAENSQLIVPSWTLVKKDGYVLWGMSIVNKALGGQNQDKYKRPVRGFFGFISDSQISILPYDIAYFKELYDAYVLPIWESYEQTDQVIGKMPQALGLDYIEKSQRFIDEINKEEDICRLFPSDTDSRALIEAVFASADDCSIATNVHSKKQCVDFGKEKISFSNAVMASDTKLNKTEDLNVFVQKNIEDNATNTPIEDSIDIQKNSPCLICGNPIEADENVCKDCKNKQRNKKYIKYGLYGFMTLICILFVFKGSSIWEKILPSKHTQEKVWTEEDRQEGRRERINSKTSFLTTNKPKVNVVDANSDDVFKFAYESSSLIMQVISADNWIRIITPQQQFSKKGIIEFMCEPLPRGSRKGTVCLTNDEGVETMISIYQTVTSEDRNVDNTSQTVKSTGNRSDALRNIMVRESEEIAAGDAHNLETTSAVEPTNH